ncbi:ABC transporter ATP-binding protein [Microbacterium sp. Marseille-Q6965]|uniref:ABC transporter ATP-binding protein n=1 Tax=Microbacterium sp. Marseille-Q6965 TaxID=2965072 RepID=UPI0021B76B8C|nr:ATP-binding cassette domain-containing protein [Microbacterium sp. Marseille-Q6965]
MSELFRLTEVGHRYVRGAAPALEDVSLALRQGRSLGIVGESGSGKTTLTRALLGLLAPSTGSVTYRGEPVPLGRRGGAAARRFRRRVQLVLQDPFASLNPRARVGEIVAEPLRILEPRSDPRPRVAEVLAAVELDPGLARRWPHELSGGQRQRVAIARAIGPRPEVIVADEPVSALDVSVRRNVIRLLRRLAEHEGVTLVVVSHDFGIVHRLCAETAVMHGGRIVEQGETREILERPEHPYTRGLLESIPRLPPRNARERAGGAA